MLTLYFLITMVKIVVAYVCATQACFSTCALCSGSDVIGERPSLISHVERDWWFVSKESMAESSLVAGTEPLKTELAPEGVETERDQELLQPGSGEEAASLVETKTRKLQVAPLGKKQKESPAIPKGRPKSGRVWKDPSKKRFSDMIQDKPLRTSWECKMRERQARKLVKDFAQHLKDDKQRAREEKKQRREENLKRRLENERKAEIVQVIRNPLKLKRAKKKQLRRIEKRDTLALLQKHQAQRKAAKE